MTHELDRHLAKIEQQMMDDAIAMAPLRNALEPSSTRISYRFGAIFPKITGRLLDFEVRNGLLILAVA
jgi:hypothetical protein